MALVFIVTTGLTGILNASMELNRLLKINGHTTINAAISPVKEKVEVNGLNYLEIESINFKPTPKPKFEKGKYRIIKNLVSNHLNAKKRRKEAINNLNLKTFEETVLRLNPDFIIADIELHDYIICLQSIDIPFILLSQWFSVFKSPGFPSISSNYQPSGYSFINFLNAEFSWARLRVKRIFRISKQMFLTGFCDRRTVLKLYAKKQNISTNIFSSLDWVYPFTYPSFPHINMTYDSLEFDYKRNPNHYYLGPMVFENRKDSFENENEEQRFNEILNIKIKQRKKLIYCLVSTLFKGDLSFLEKVINATKDVEDWIVIITLGGKFDTSYFEDCPDNIHLFKFIPQLDVLKVADCCINHAGIHSIHECIHYEVPMVVYSGKKADQNGCAARLDYFELAVIGDKDKDNTEDIRKNIEAVMTDNKYRSNIQRIKKSITSAEQAKHLNEIIHKYMNLAR